MPAFQRHGGLPRRGLACGQAQFQAHRLGGQFAEHRLDQPGVLRTDPVEFEAVGYAHADHGRFAGVVLQHGGWQRADPGVELVFGQLLGKPVAGALPQVWGHCGKLVSSGFEL